jgi:UDP-N-acetylglucosamine/UDP-N-acetylgalactosamine diphosphorylase
MYRISEVCALLGIKPHVLRYWEQEMPLLSPEKNLTGRKIYAQKDLQILLRLRHLIYDKKYTMQGAREKIWEEIQEGDPDIRSRIAEVKGDLLKVSHLIKNRMRKYIKRNSYLEHLKERNQGHLFDYWDSRPDHMKKRLLEDLKFLDLNLLEVIEEILGQKQEKPGHIQPVEYIAFSDSKKNIKARAMGEECIASGKTAFITVAGGQGSRLGFDGPKGMFPISPIRKASLFQIFAEKLLSAGLKYDVSIPWYIMTSSINHEQTCSYFEKNSYFGLDKEQVVFFSQGLLPSFDDSGKLILAEDGGIFKNPDGHGGLIRALKRNKLLADMQKRGIEELFCFQIDNPLVNVPDPAFLGTHLSAGAQVSSKVIRKAYPEEKLGVIGKVDGKPGIIEYSDLDKESMYAKDKSGEFLFSQGSIAIHLMNVAFLRRKDLELPYHTARKKIKALIPGSSRTEIVEKEATKLEMFIFDIIPMTDTTLFYETLREEEFAPLKNKTGIDSVESCIDGQIAKAATHFAACGVTVPVDGNGKSLYRLEVSPLFALDEESLREKLKGVNITIDEDELFI